MVFGGGGELWWLGAIDVNAKFRLVVSIMSLVVACLSLIKRPGNYIEIRLRCDWFLLPIPACMVPYTIQSKPA